MKTASKVYTALIFIFLYAPIIVLIIFSFNDTDTASRTQFFRLYTALVSAPV